MKRIITSLLILLPLCSHADMPYINNSVSESYERVTTGDITCESRKPHSTLNTGVYSGNQDYRGYGYTNEDKGVYVALSIPLTNKSKQVDCNDLYNTALEKERLRVKQLEMQVEMYKSRRVVAD